MEAGTQIGNLRSISPQDVTSRIFAFSTSASKRPLTENLILLNDGRIGGYSHKNEVYWGIENNNLVFFTEKKRRSCIFSLIVENKSKLLNFSGRFLLKNQSIIHRLEEVKTSKHRLDNLPDILQFRGEFGEEMNHFVPHIYWLYKNKYFNRERKIETYEGMAPFYFFLAPEQIKVVAEKRRYVSPRKAPSYYLHGSGLLAQQTGMELAPDYRNRFGCKFNTDKPILVIHNKYSIEWGGQPINYFDEPTLEHLFLTLKDKYQIIYFEAVSGSTNLRGYSFDFQDMLPYNDTEIARRHPDVWIFGDMLNGSEDSYNLLKLKIFSSCHFFITTQGGNSHMCALFPGSLVAILHKKGREDRHAYIRGTFQFLSNPSPIYLIGRDGETLREISSAFEDATFLNGRVHLGERGLDLYRRFNPSHWRHSSTSR